MILVTPLRPPWLPNPRVYNQLGEHILNVKNTQKYAFRAFFFGYLQYFLYLCALIVFAMHSFVVFLNGDGVLW